MRRAGRGRGLRGNQSGAPQPNIGRQGQQHAQELAHIPTPQPTTVPQPVQVNELPRSTVNSATERFSQLQISARNDQPGSSINKHDDQRSRDQAGRSRMYRTKNDQIRTKPKEISITEGTTGNRIQLLANFYVLNDKPDWFLYLYHVAFSPEIDVTVVKKALLKEHAEKLGLHLFDGQSLWTNNVYCDQNKDITLVSKRKDGQTVKITIKHVSKVEQGSYQYIQVFNSIIRNCTRMLGTIDLGKGQFNPTKKITLMDQKLELWPGYLTSISQRENCIMLQVEPTYKVFRLETALDIINKISRNEYFQKNVRNALIGTVVLTDYNNRTHRVVDIDFNFNPSSKFENYKTKEQCTFIEYFHKNYQLRIRDLKQPLLVTKTTARQRRSGMPLTILLIPEFCRMTGITEDIRSNFNAMKSIIQYTRIAPNIRIDRLNEYHRELKGNSAVTQFLKDWNMKVDDKLVELTGRQLPVEGIVLGNQKVLNNYEKSDFTRDLRVSSMYYAVPLQTWGVISCLKVRADVDRFIRTLQQVAETMKFRISQPKVTFLNERENSSSILIAEIDKLYNEINPQLIMVLLPNNRADRYNAVKLRCSVHKGVPSQVVLAKNLDPKKSMSVATKIAIQINAKLGGAPWSVINPLQKSGGTMVIGFDVCHDPRDKSRSFGATVASISSDMAQYYSCVTAHANGEELSSNFAINVLKALCAFRKANNGALPSTIFVYRDGVGEGQLYYVHETEVKAVKERLRDIYKEADMPFKFAFIVVTKRLAVRFFGKGHNSQSVYNPPAGTVVDNIVTDPLKYDFYLISQHINHGTVSPTHYNVIEDTTGLDADKMQRWTFKLTHMYYNWTGAISVPGQCQLAHKLAFLTSQSLHTSPHQNISDLLHFL